MSIEEMLESDDYEIFELGLKLKEERDGDISIAERFNYCQRMHQKSWIKAIKALEIELLWGKKK